MLRFDDLVRVRQVQIEKKFVLPKDTSKVLVDDENFVPFERISGALVGCTVKNDNFHLHENKAKQW